MGLEADLRQPRSTHRRLIGRGCLAVLVALTTLSLHVDPPLAQLQQPVEAASTSPFWLDPPPSNNDTMAQRPAHRSASQAHEPAAVKLRKLVQQPVVANSGAGPALTSMQQMPALQAAHLEILANHKMPQRAAVSLPTRSRESHDAVVPPASPAPSQIDQEFSRAFSGSENTLTASNPVQDLHHDLQDTTEKLHAGTALQPERGTDTVSESPRLATPIQMGDVAVKAEALVQHNEPTSGVALGSRYDAVNVRTSITVPTFHHPLRLSVGGGYERLVQPNEGRSGAALDAPPNTGTDEGSSDVGTSSAPALNGASRLDLQRTGYVATASMPVSTHLDVGVGYSQHQVRGGAGLTQSTPIEEHQELYTGSVTYAPGDGRSSVSIVGRASRAIDTLAPVDATVKRGDILFSVKF